VSFIVATDDCVKDCLVRLQAADAEFSSIGWSRCCMWYALLFHRLIKAIPPGVVSDVRLLIQRCMADPDRKDPVNCRVAWMPHTHHLFPDAFKVMRVVGGWWWLLTLLEGSCDGVPAVCQEDVQDDAPRHPPHDHCTMGSC
jgi:hypothetical protein